MLDFLRTLFRQSPWRNVGKVCIQDVHGNNDTCRTEHLYRHRDGYYRVGRVLFPQSIWHVGSKRTCGPGFQAMRVRRDACCYDLSTRNWMTSADF